MHGVVMQGEEEEELSYTNTVRVYVNLLSLLKFNLFGLGHF